MSRREYFRVVYPISARPQFEAGNANFAVIDCSETGLNCGLVPGGDVPSVGTAFDGVIYFKSGEETSVAGEVVRSDGQTIGVALKRKAIPFAVILNEQRFLRQRFLNAE